MTPRAFGRRRLLLRFYFVAAALAHVAACTSDLELCTQANADASKAWQAYANTMQSGVDDARAKQSDAQTKMTREVEPRLAANAASAASARYDRSTNAWMRAYKTEQAAACDKDAACKQLKHQNHDAVERVKDLTPKLSAALGVISSIGGDPTKTKTLADAIAPETGNELLTAAKTSSAVAFEACEGVERPSPPTR